MKKQISKGTEYPASAQGGYDPAEEGMRAAREDARIARAKARKQVRK